MGPTKEDAKKVIADHFNALLNDSSLGNRAKQLVVTDVTNMLDVLTAEPPEENDED